MEPSLSPQKRRDALARLERAADPRTRFVDCVLVFRRRLTGEQLLRVGDRWDRVEHRYVSGAERCKVVYVNESQLSAMLAFKRWLGARLSGQERDIMIFGGGNRGGGKTHFCVLAALAVCLAVPGARAWAVSATLDKREELERIVKSVVPSSWRTYRGMPEYRFTLANDSSVKVISGDLPETLKRGGVELVFLNEAQDMQREVFTLGLPAIRDTGGLMLLAGNPPQRSKGVWTLDLKDAVEAGQIAGTYHDFDARLNVNVDQVALGKIGAALAVVDPRAHAADALGLWRRPGELAYAPFRSWSRSQTHQGADGIARMGHVGDLPELGLIDVTALVTGARKTGRERGYPFLAGADFQRRPHLALLVLKVYRLPDGRFLYHPVDEILAEGTEEDLSEAMYSRGLDPGELLVVADASGAWQNVERKRSGKYSHDILRAEGWSVVAPAKAKNPEQARYGVGRNPVVEDSLSQMWGVLEEDRLLVHPKCSWLIESMRKCPTKRVDGRTKLDERGGYTHITDCLRYAIWYLEPPKRLVAVTATRTAGREVLPRRI